MANQIIIVFQYAAGLAMILVGIAGQYNMGLCIRKIPLIIALSITCPSVFLLLLFLINMTVCLVSSLNSLVHDSVCLSVCYLYITTRLLLHVFQCLSVLLFLMNLAVICPVHIFNCKIVSVYKCLSTLVYRK